MDNEERIKRLIKLIERLYKLDFQDKPELDNIKRTGILLLKHLYNGENEYSKALEDTRLTGKGRPLPDDYQQKIWSEGKYKMITTLELAIKDFEYLEKKNQENQSFWDIIHPDIIRVSKKKFEDEHYADSVESAFKEINNRIKKKYLDVRGTEIDGTDLMRQAFKFNSKSTPPEEPVIKLSNLSERAGRDIQEGYMQIFAGSMQGIRNPKAHANIIIYQDEAIHFIFLASLLMKRID